MTNKELAIQIINDRIILIENHRYFTMSVEQVAKLSDVQLEMASYMADEHEQLEIVLNLLK